MFQKSFTTRDIGLLACFTALYALLASIPVFQILGMPSNNITAAAIIVPLIGFMLGPYVGVAATALGGVIAIFAVNLSIPSFVSGSVAACMAGLQCTGKRGLSFFLYFLFFTVLCFYPATGPFWVFPLYVWFQAIGLVILISPLGLIAINNMGANGNRKLSLSLFLVSLTSTLAGQISGSLAFMLGAQAGIIVLPREGWQVFWAVTSARYPIERVIIALGAASIGVPLSRVLQSANLTALFKRDNPQTRCP